MEKFKIKNVIPSLGQYWLVKIIILLSFLQFEANLLFLIKIEIAQVIIFQDWPEFLMAKYNWQ